MELTSEVDLNVSKLSTVIANQLEKTLKWLYGCLNIQDYVFDDGTE